MQEEICKFTLQSKDQTEITGIVTFKTSVTYIGLSSYINARSGGECSSDHVTCRKPYCHVTVDYTFDPAFMSILVFNDLSVLDAADVFICGVKRLTVVQ